MNSLLSISNLNKAFGGNQLFKNVEVKINHGSICLLTGDNGTGKSTLFNMITGYEQADAGRILFQGEQISNQKPMTVSKLGISRLFQSPRVFKNLTVEENLKVANGERVDVSLDLFKQFGLSKQSKSLVGSLSIGQQKLVSLCTIIATSAKLILLDEPLAGLAESVIPKVKSEIVRMKEKKGTSFFIIEHKRERILDICDQEYNLVNHHIFQV